MRKALQIFAELPDLALQLFEPRRGLFHRLVLRLHFARQLAQFALERQRSAAGLLAAADRMTVIAHAIRQQEEASGCCTDSVCAAARSRAR